MRLKDPIGNKTLSDTQRFLETTSKFWTLKENY